MTVLSTVQQHFLSRTYSLFAHNRIFGGTISAWLDNVRHIHQENGEVLSASFNSVEPPLCWIDITEHSILRVHRTIVRLHRISTYRAISLSKSQPQWLGCYSKKCASTYVVNMPLSTINTAIKQHCASLSDLLTDEDVY